MPKRAVKTETKAFDELVRVIMEGASGFDNVGFVQASMHYLGQKKKKDPMEAFVETVWDLFFDKATPTTAKVRVMEMMARCLAKIPDGRLLEQNLPNLTDDQLREAREKLLGEVARRIGPEDLPDVS